MEVEEAVAYKHASYNIQLYLFFVCIENCVKDKDMYF